MELDIRWQQRFSNYCNALDRLSEAVGIVCNSAKLKTTGITLEQEGLVQRFEFTYELAWNVMKDYAQLQEIPNVRGSVDAIRAALKMEIITDGEAWIVMKNDRNLTAHAYDQNTAEGIVLRIMNNHIHLLTDFRIQMEQILSEQ